MSLNRIDGNLYIAGQLIVDKFNPPSACVGDDQMDASSPIDTDKQRHLHTKCSGQIAETSTYDETTPVHVALSSGTVVQFQAGQREAITGDSTITVDLKKNGVSILSDIIDLDNTVAAYEQVVAGIDPTLQAYAIGDVFEVVVTVTDGTGTPGEGLFSQAVFNEGAF